MQNVGEILSRSQLGNIFSYTHLLDEDADCERDEGSDREENQSGVLFKAMTEIQIQRESVEMKQDAITQAALVCKCAPAHAMRHQRQLCRSRTTDLKSLPHELP